MNQSGLWRGVLHAVGVVSNKSEVGVLVNTHGNEALDLAKRLGSDSGGLVRPNLGVRCRKSSNTLHRGEEDLADVGAVSS